VYTAAYGSYSGDKPDFVRLIFGHVEYLAFRQSRCKAAATPVAELKP
jgi:hypothetical protein